MKKYRLYIDESGTHKYPKNDNLWEKSLGLTGIIVCSEINEAVLQPRIRGLKKLFIDDLDEPLPVFHRDEMTRRLGCFKKLADDEFRGAFDAAFLGLLGELDFTICCVVIDKQVHRDTYKYPAHPYHYCLTTMLERYVNFLDTRSATGDVMAEARGGQEDMALKKVYADFYEAGTEYRRPVVVQRTLSSKELKMKRKVEQVNGLELADLLAIPTKLDVLSTYGKTALQDNFNKKIIDNVQGKYFKNWMGTVKGYGKKII
jgi:hypothetical protein